MFNQSSWAWNAVLVDPMFQECRQHNAVMTLRDLSQGGMRSSLAFTEEIL